MSAGLRFLDQMVREGRTTVTPALYSEQTGASPQAAWNTLNRLADQGLLDRIARGRYAVRELGLLGTSPAAEGLAVAVASMFEGRPHRMGFRAALAHHGLLVQPWRVVQVATPLRLRTKKLAGRPLEVVHEDERTMHIGAEVASVGAWVSTPERAIVECAIRPDLGGGAEVLGQALVALGDFNLEPLGLLSDLHGFRTGIRRVGSVAEVIGKSQLAESLYQRALPIAGDIELEPSMPLDGEVGYRDKRWWVRWATSPDEVLAEVRQ